MRRSTIANVLAVLIAGWFTGSAAAQSNRIVLITPEEAKLPNAVNADLSFRAGVTRGPALVLLAPKSDANVQSPIHLELRFQGHGGAEIELNTLRVVYIKNPVVDLTSRLKTFALPTGINVLEAEVPPGAHAIRAEIKDKDGRVGFLNFTLNVMQ